MLSLEYFHSLLALKRPEELFNRLQETALRDYVGQRGWEDWSDISDRFHAGVLTELRYIIPNPVLTDMFLLAGDYLNLKRSLLDQDQTTIPAGTIREEHRILATSGDYALLPEELRQALQPFQGKMHEAPVRRQLSAIMDGAYLRQQLSMAATLAAPLITECVEMQVLAQTVAALWRANLAGGNEVHAVADALIPLGNHNLLITALADTQEVRAWTSLLPGDLSGYFKTALEDETADSVARFLALAADRVLDIAKSAKMQTMGPERVWGYLTGLGAEVYNLRLVLSGVINGIPEDLLRGRLRETYV